MGSFGEMFVRIFWQCLPNWSCNTKWAQRRAWGAFRIKLTATFSSIHVVCHSRSGSDAIGGPSGEGCTVQALQRTESTHFFSFFRFDSHTGLALFPWLCVPKVWAQRSSGLA
ncbi:hypothetical protein M758_12G078000 [Ceratodon purpureus]|nr:hypothetical protein M758_12G078000 [Ceratodon purpureus]